MHTCHAIGCKIETGPAMFMCRRHWFYLLPKMRNEIWRTYRPGQEKDKRPSREYCKAAKACLLYIAAWENRRIVGTEPELLLYDVYAPTVER